MFNLEDEFITGSYKIPWLIWIQLLIMLLLILLLYSFTLFALDEFPDTNNTNKNNNSIISPASHQYGFFSLPQKGKMPLVYNNNKNNDPSTSSTFDAICMRSTTSKIGGQNRRAEIASGPSKRVSGGTNVNGRENSATRDTNFSSPGFPEHPCYIFRLAREVFLKCLGLDCISEASTKRQHSRED